MSQRRTSTRKKQTRLSFTPVPSSSPQRSLANVRYDDTPSPLKRRRLARYFLRDELASSSSESQPIRGAKLQVVVESPRKRPGNNTEIRDAPALLPTPEASSQAEVKSPADPFPTGPQSNSTSNDNRESRKKDEQSIASSDEEENLVFRSAREPRPAPIRVESTSGDDSDPILPSSRRAQCAEGSPSSPRTPSKPLIRPRACNFLLGGSSNNAPLSESQRRRSTTQKKASRARSHSKDVQVDPDSVSDEEPVQFTPRRTPRLSGKQRKKAKRILGWDVTGHETDDEASVTRTSQPRYESGQQSKPDSEVLEISDANERSDNSDTVTSPTQRRRTTNGVDEAAPEESEDLQNEVDDLRDSDTEIRTTRLRDGAKASERSKRLQILEELKQRRSGIVGVQDEGDSEEADASESEDHTPIFSRFDSRDEYEEDFVDDEDAILGVDLGRAGVPLKFTYHANKKPIDYFQNEIEWMVHNKLDPAFDRNDEVYELAHDKLDDEVQGQAGSRFISSAWKEEFLTALKTKPDISRVDVPIMLEHKCDACSRSGHPPKHKITLSGGAYDRKSLEKISPDDDDESGPESVASDSQKDEDREQHFFLGRFCCANAEIAHALHHWRYQLNQTVLEWLMVNDYTSPHKIVEREGWSRKKREKLANKVVDGMVESGEMRDLYMQFRQNLEAARSAKPERFSNEH